VNNLVKLLPLSLALFGVELPESVEPSELDHLLREEEAANEVRLGTPE